MVAQASGEVLAAGLESLGDLLGDKLDGLTQIGKDTAKLTGKIALAPISAPAKAAAKATKFMGRQTLNALKGVGSGIKGLGESFKGGLKDMLPGGKDILGLLKKGALAALIPLLIMFFQSPFFQKIKDTFMNDILPFLKDVYENILKPLGEFLLDIGLKAFTAIKDFFFNTLVPIVTDLYENVLKPLYDDAIVLFKELWEQFKVFFSETLVPIMKNLYENIIIPIKDLLVDSFVKYWEDLKEAFKGMVDGIMMIFDGDVLGGITKIFTSLGEYFVSTLDNLSTLLFNTIAVIFRFEGTDSVGGSITKFFNDLYDNITGFFVGIYDGTVNLFNEKKDQLLEFLSSFAVFTFLTDTFKNVIDTVKSIFSGDFSLANFKKLIFGGVTSEGKAVGGLMDLIYYPINVAVNVIKDIFKFGDPDQPFVLSDFLFGEEGVVTKIFNYLKELLSVGNIIDKVGGFFSGLFGGDEEGGEGGGGGGDGKGRKLVQRVRMTSTDRNGRPIGSTYFKYDDGTYSGVEYGGGEPSEQFEVDAEDYEEMLKLAQSPDGVASGMYEVMERRLGGPVARGMPYLVGEAGPELVVPQQTGDVISNERLNMMEQAVLKNTNGGASSSAPPIINAPTVTTNNQNSNVSGSHPIVDTDPILRRLSDYAI